MYAVAYPLKFFLRCADDRVHSIVSYLDPTWQQLNYPDGVIMPSEAVAQADTGRDKVRDQGRCGGAPHTWHPIVYPNNYSGAVAGDWIVSVDNDTRADAEAEVRGVRWTIANRQQGWERTFDTDPLMLLTALASFIGLTQLTPGVAPPDLEEPPS